MTVQETSKEAYEEIKKDIGSRQLEVLRALLELGKANNTMIAKKLNKPVNTITPRIHELRNDLKLVSFSDKAPCPYTKRSSMFWMVLNSQLDKYGIERGCKDGREV